MNLPDVRAPYLDPAAEALLAAAPAPRRALLLDRDGVINVNHGYVHSPERTEWIPGVFELVAAARGAGYLPVVVTNQAGIGRGYYSEAQFLEYTAWLHREFAQRGAGLLATYWCPHHPEAGRGEYHVACGCRKPQPGMLLAAAADFALDMHASLLVGDSRSDRDAALAAGVGRAYLLKPGQRLSTGILQGHG